MCIRRSYPTSGNGFVSQSSQVDCITFDFVTPHINILMVEVQRLPETLGMFYRLSSLII
jgi:hypothetical protein